MTRVAVDELDSEYTPIEHVTIEQVSIDDFGDAALLDVTTGSTRKNRMDRSKSLDNRSREGSSMTLVFVYSVGN